jgi:protocatechuate 3,4-dioxygenase beta subunit
MRVPPLLLHRFVLVPLILAVVAIGWNIYVAANADGIIEGKVVDAAGRPVAGAEVAFFERNMLNYEERQHTRTDASGSYRFTNMQQHIGQLEARTPDGRKSERLQLRLWFRAQHTRAAALVVG